MMLIRAGGLAPQVWADRKSSALVAEVERALRREEMKFELVRPVRPVCSRRVA